MAIVYVNSITGHSKAPGTAARPLRDLAHAIAVAGPGGAVEACGTFGGQTVHVPRLTLVGNDATIRAADSAHGILVFAPKVTICDFIVEQSRGGGIAAARGVDFLTLRRNLIWGNRGNGVSLIGGSGHIVQDNRILGNIGTRDRHSSGISILNPRAVETTAAYQLKILGNTIAGNGTLAGTDGFGMIADKWTVSTPTPFDGWALIADNQFSSNWNSGFYAYHARNIVLRGNTFAGNGTDPRFKRAVEIGLNDAQGVKLLRNIVTRSDRPSLALLGNTTAVALANNQLGDLAPWSRPLAA